MKREQSLQVYSQEKSVKGAENDCSSHRSLCVWSSVGAGSVVGRATEVAGV